MNHCPECAGTCGCDAQIEIAEKQLEVAAALVTKMTHLVLTLTTENRLLREAVIRLTMPTENVMAPHFLVGHG